MWFRALIIARAPSFEKREGHGVLFKPASDILLLEGTPFFWKALPQTGVAMINPRYVNEVIANVRGIKPGWYAMDDVGNLSTGPFSSKVECRGTINEPTYEQLVSSPK